MPITATDGPTKVSANPISAVESAQGNRLLMRNPAVEKSVLGVLMGSPAYRGELVNRFPGESKGLFGFENSRLIFEAIMSQRGVVTPQMVEPHLTEEQLNSPWHPQRIFDGTSLEEGEPDLFWQNVETLRQARKRRELEELFKNEAGKVYYDPDVDAYASSLSDALARITSTNSTRYDPTMRALRERFLKLREKGEVGQKISSGIPGLDTHIGGFQIDPGELVTIAGFPKMRKTSLLVSIILAMHRKGVEGSTIWVCNEPSVDSINLLATMWATEAAYLVRERGIYRAGQDGILRWPMISKEIVKNNRFDNWPALGQAVQDAFDRVTSHDIRVYCAPIDEGNAGEFDAIKNVVAADIEFNGGRRVIVDNLQGWLREGDDDYANMIRVVPPCAAFTSKYRCLTFLVSQYNKAGGVKGSGGLEGHIQLGIECRYNDKEDPHIMTVKRFAGRDRPYFEASLSIDPSSGLLYEGLFPVNPGP